MSTSEGSEEVSLAEETGQVRVCVSAYVFGSYKRFIPLFCYSTVKSYPEYTVKIFVDGGLGKAEAKSLEDIRKNVSKNLIIQEHAFDGVNLSQTPKINGGNKKLLRWLFERRDFEGFDCVYFSDVDFLVLRQDPPLADFHLANAQSLGLPFSNMVRADKSKTGQGSKRLTGLHFVLTDRYFSKIDAIVREYKENPELISQRVPDAINDEHFLYHLVSRAIPFDSKQLCGAPRPSPGYHLAWSRNPKRLKVRTKRLVNAEGSGNPVFPRTYQQVQAFCDDPVFLRTLWGVRVPEAILLLAYIGVTPSKFVNKQRFLLLLSILKLKRLGDSLKARLGLG